MSAYEMKLKTKYENLGYKFLCDVVGSNVTQVTQRVSNQFGKRVFSVQGDCVHFDPRKKRGYSRYLVFEK